MFNPVMQQLIGILQERFFVFASLSAVADGNQQLNIAELLNVARLHGVDWLICNELQQQSAFEGDCCSVIQNAGRLASVAALKNCACLLEIAAICNRHRLNVVFFKGAALAVSLYNNVAARRYCDVDLLVESYDEAERLRKLLSNSGYKSFDGDTFSHHFKRRFHIEFQLVNSEGIGVDIHWKLFHDHYVRFPFYLNGEKTSENVSQKEDSIPLNCRKVLIYGREVQTFGPEENLVILCAHHTTHSWSELRHVCDIAALLTAFPEIDHDRVFRLARQLKISRMLCVALRLAQMIMKKGYRQNWQELEQDRLSKVLASYVWKRLKSGNSNVPKGKAMLFEIMVRDSWPDRIRFLVGAATSPSDNDLRLVRLNSRFFWLYYLIRPVRQAMLIIKALLLP